MDIESIINKGIKMESNELYERITLLKEEMNDYLENINMWNAEKTKEIGNKIKLKLGELVDLVLKPYEK